MISAIYLVQAPHFTGGETQVQGDFSRVIQPVRSRVGCSSGPFQAITLWHKGQQHTTGLAALETPGSQVTPLTIQFNKMSYQDVSKLKALQDSASQIWLVMRTTRGTCQKLKSPDPFPDPRNQLLHGEGPGRLNF